MSGILTKHHGRVLSVRHDPVFSPNIQGKTVWSLLTQDQRDHLNAVLDHASKNMNVSRRDLQWKIDKYGAIHIRRWPRIVL